MGMFLKRLRLFSIATFMISLVSCGGGGSGEDNKGWIEITNPSSEDYFEVVDGNLDMLLAGQVFISNFTASDNSNCDNYIDLIFSDCEDYERSDVWVEIINESNDTRTKNASKPWGAWFWTITLSPGINSILVVAEDSKGNRGTDRITINVVLPGVPAGVSVQTDDGDTIVFWNTVLGATSYNIYYASSPGVTKTNYSTLPNGEYISGATSPQSVTGLVNGIPYYFVVTAINTEVESRESLELTATALGVPTGISISDATNVSAVISWDAVLGATSYNIYYASSPGVTKTNYSTLPNGNKVTGATSPQSVTGLANGIPYYFIVTAKNAGGESEESLELIAAERGVPLGASVADATNDSVTVSWDTVLGATSYNIYYASSPGVTKTNYSTLPNGDKVNGATAPLSITGLTIGNDYYFVVTSENSSGESAESSELSAHIGPTMSFDVKTFRFSWIDVPSATHYRLLENPDGISGFSQVESDIPQGTEKYDHIVPLYSRINASYILQSCIGVDCTDFGLFYIIDNLVDAIGYLKASGGRAGRFGHSVSLSDDGNTLAVGAISEASSTSGINTIPDNLAWPDAGAAYVFVYSGSNWSQQAYVKASNTDSNDFFGFSVSLSGDGNTLAVGALGESSSTSGIDTIPDNLAAWAGAVYVFRRSGSNWSQQAYVKASNTDSNDFFGFSVSLSGDGNTLAVGAWGESSSTSGINTIPDNLASHAGAVYVFSRSFSDWSQQAYVKASNTDTSDRFGQSVSLSGDGNTLAVGAIREHSSTSGINNVPIIAGAAYVFIYDSSYWSQQAYIKASNFDSGDDFGHSVSLSGDGNTLAVGALGESSSTSGIDTISDNLAAWAGAVYVFNRNFSDWSQQAYIKASNTRTHDRFGHSVSLSADGNTLAVGATGEDSSTRGINTVPTYLASAAGAAYVFNRNFSDWSQQAYVKASNTEGLHIFGSSVSLSGDGNTLAVGATGEDSVYLY